MINKSDIDYTKINNASELIKLLRENSVPENQFWRFLGAYQEKKAREKGIPLCGQFELTASCNLDCKMCYVHLEHDCFDESSLLPVEWWKNIMYQAHSLGMMNATLTGGECLLYPGLDELYLYLRSMGIMTEIKTNGILLNRERVSFFNKYPPRNVIVSLYGSSNETYKNVTGHKAFDIVYNNLLLLKNVSFPVSIAITPSKYMYNDIANTLDLAKQLGFPFMINMSLFPPRKETGRELCDLSFSEYVEVFKMVKEEKPTCELPLKKVKTPEYNSDKIQRIGIPCGAGRSFFSVSWNGSMTSCDNLDSLRISLLDNTFSEAWDIIHSDVSSYPLPVECFACEYEKACYSCVAYRNNGVEKGHCNPDICRRTELLVKEGIASL